MNNILSIARTVWLEMIRRKDVYIVLILQGFFTLLLTTVDAFGSDTPSSYIMDIGLMLAFLLSIVLSITIGARQIPNEIRSGTIFSILTKPISRLEFLLGKWLGLWCGMVLANALFYCIVTAITLTKGYVFEPAVLIQVFCLHSALLGLILAICLFFTMFMSQAAGGTATGIFIVVCYLFLPRVPNLLVFAEGWRAKTMLFIYQLAPHLELFDMRMRVLHGWGTLSPLVFLGTLAYGALLTSAFLALTWLIFRKKYFTRGSSL
ncbi:ABC transporter permease subunit [Pontiellaceae bacterium B12219]|nr:ABC transporter permease subunit [Pontiellaceae bacterium B12219]